MEFGQNGKTFPCAVVCPCITARGLVVKQELYHEPPEPLIAKSQNRLIQRQNTRIAKALAILQRRAAERYSFSLRILRSLKYTVKQTMLTKAQLINWNIVDISASKNPLAYYLYFYSTKLAGNVIHDVKNTKLRNFCQLYFTPGTHKNPVMLSSFQQIPVKFVHFALDRTSRT